ncbi:aldo/keto reductase [Campylobacter iguaniorum]|uniref:aldo/keto reductase n=1 Tax=Campylobacter iguaniorum TaxID=1244531 RepID=UPI00073AAF9F|nr:aldo/keto reductase [Campylobacter iguaniorum]ALV25323.1 aldo/keto reductase [Campylobacter iguaniorum]
MTNKNSRREFLKSSTKFIGGLAVLGGTGSLNEIFANATKSTATNFEIRKIGDMKVSAVGLGCVDFAPIGYYGCQNQKSDIIKLVRRAFDNGITLFDTAEIYGMTTSEEWLGEAIAPFKNQVKVETKFGFEVAENRPGVLNSKPTHIKKAVEGSLKRLKTDHIDMLFQHRVDKNTPIEEVADVVNSLIKEGKVLRWGLCEASANTIRKAHAISPISAIESEYAIWWREPETKIFPTLEELGIDFVAYSPLARGYLTGVFNANSKFALPDRRAVLPRFSPEAMKHNAPLLELVQKWAKAKDVTPAQFCLVWALSQRPYIIAIPGTTKVPHLDELCGAKGIRMSQEEIAKFDKEYAKIDILGHRANEAIEAQIDK